MALTTALSGLMAAQNNLNTIGNNLANADTTGFKASREEFGDIYSQSGYALVDNQIGSGVMSEEVSQQFTQGDISSTGNPLDLAISGNGFFVVSNGNGTQYTRAGDFQTNPQNYVVTPTGSNLMVYPPVKGGGFDESTLQPLQLKTSQASAVATTAVDVSSNLPADATVPTNAFSPTDSTSYNASSPVTVYDSQGGSHNAVIYYVKTGTNTWNANLYVDGTSAGTASMTFNANGNLATPANGQLSFGSVALTNGANPLTLSLNVQDTTQFGTAFSEGTVSQNGYAAGTLSNVSFGSDGTVTAYYSNNQSVVLGQVAMASFANDQGLTQMGDATWTASANSGAAIMGSANAGTFGTIQSGSLEQSNTSDTTAQLVDLIGAQQAYQANAQVLSTSDTMESSLINAVSH